VCLYQLKFSAKEEEKLVQKTTDRRTIPCPDAVRCGGKQELKFVVKPTEKDKAQFTCRLCPEGSQSVKPGQPGYQCPQDKCYVCITCAAKELRKPNELRNKVNFDFRKKPHDQILASLRYVYQIVYQQVHEARQNAKLASMKRGANSKNDAGGGDAKSQQIIFKNIFQPNAIQMDYQLLRIIEHLGHDEYGIFAQGGGSGGGGGSASGGSGSSGKGKTQGIDLQAQRAYWYRWQQNYYNYLTKSEYQGMILQRSLTKSNSPLSENEQNSVKKIEYFERLVTGMMIVAKVQGMRFTGALHDQFVRFFQRVHNRSLTAMSEEDAQKLQQQQQQ
jgi:hypothetical protein